MHDAQSQSDSNESASKTETKQIKKGLHRENTPSCWSSWLTATHPVNAGRLRWTYGPRDSWSYPPRKEENEPIPPWMKFKGLKWRPSVRTAVPPKSQRERNCREAESRDFPREANGSKKKKALKFSGRQLFQRKQNRAENGFVCCFFFLRLPKNRINKYVPSRPSMHSVRLYNLACTFHVGLRKVIVSLKCKGRTSKSVSILKKKKNAYAHAVPLFSTKMESKKAGEGLQVLCGRVG